MTNVTRRNFLAGSAAAAGMAGLAACSSGSEASSTSGSSPTSADVLAAPDASSYPIEPDGDGVEALYTSEETRDGWTRYTNPEGAPEIGVMDTARMIQVDGLAFRDMNGDGKLDFYEDWRQSIDDRAADLASQLQKEDLWSLLWAGGTQSNNMTTDTSAMDYIEAGSRCGVSRLQSDAESYASDVAWINSVQELCEQSTYGIPYLNFSDPYVLFDVPSSVGLAACMDKDIWRKAGMWQARAWRSAGVRMELGPQIDVYSNPIGVRLSGSVSEDPALNRDFAAEFGGGMQSTWGDDEATDDQGWGSESCAVMLKHFVGEGSNEGGRNDHTDMGKWNVFPGSNFDAHLIPFMDGGMKLNSKTEQMAAIMPCYGIAYDPNDSEELGEHVGSAYSTHNISILRNAGWDGMICTDWDILGAIAHGMKDKTPAERYAKLMKNTISQHGGSFEPDVAEEAYGLLVEELGEDKTLEILRENARYMLKAMLKVDLFEQPFSDRSIAKQYMESEAAANFGADAADKCVIMLKNADGVISADGISGKVYIPQRVADGACALGIDEKVASEYFDYITDTVGDPSVPAEEEDGEASYQESDVTRLTAEELADVAYAIVKVQNPQDAFGGVEGGVQFNPMATGDEVYPDPVWKPLSLQYRPFTADQGYVRKESLNPEDEYGVLENRSVYGESTYATNESDLDLVLDIKSKLPDGAKLILIVDASNPMVFSEIEPSADVILMGWDSIVDSAFAHIITGSAEPSGLLPFQQPKDMQTVFEQLEDVPRDMDCYTDSEGNTYDFCFGLNWSGAIDDERVATYKANPLTEVENFEVKADA